MANKVEKKEEKKEEKKSPQVKVFEKEKGNKSVWFIPTGLLLGIGIGFLFENVPAWLFIGLGAGFLIFSLAKNKKE